MLRETSKCLIAITIFGIWALSGVAEADDGPCGVAPLGDNLFEPSKWPAGPFEEYARGKLGVLRSTYDHFYLVIAYRKLSGLEVSNQDIEHLQRSSPCFSRETGWGWNITATKEFRVAFDEWQDLRNSILPSRRPSLSRTYYVPAFPRSSTCNPDAYRNATETLRARLASYGSDDDVKTWIRGQDAVFDACSGEKQAVPDIVPATAPRWLWLDRQYQFAAAYFYIGNYDDALTKFDLIAETVDSPWREIAPYLSARVLIRKGYEQSLDKTIWLSAEERLKLIVSSNESSQKLRNNAFKLLMLVKLRTDPKAALAEVDQRLTARNLLDSAPQDVVDFWHAFSAVQGDPAGDLSRWISVLRGGDAKGAYGQWQSSRTMPWLVAAIMLAEPGTSEVGDLLTAASRVHKTSPAYLTVRYHMIRLTGRDSAAVSAAVRILADRELMTNYQEINSFRSLAFARSKTIHDLARFAPRVSPQRVERYAPTVDEDSTNILNMGLSLDQMFRVLMSDDLPERFEHELTSVVWTRAYVLERWDVLRRIDKRAKAMMPSSYELIDQMLAAGESRERRAIGAMLLAKYPGMVANIDKSTWYTEDGESGRLQFSRANMRRSISRDGERENWWCIMETEFPGSSRDLSARERGTGGVESRFQSELDKRTLLEERSRLEKVENATDYLGKIVIDWATDHPRDPRLPQALHMLVRSTRGGCVDGRSGLSKAMFRHLHYYFPENEWTKRTPVYYGWR